MWDKRRIHKKFSRDAGDTGDMILVEKSHVSCVSLPDVNELGRLLIVLVVALALTGCSVPQFSHWSGEASPRPAVVSQTDLATFNEAVALVESQRYEDAVGKFRQVFDRFEEAGDRQRAAESLFWIGFCREKQRRLDEARAIYLRLVREYAETRAAEEADKRRLRIPALPG